MLFKKIKSVSYAITFFKTFFNNLKSLEPCLKIFKKLFFFIRGCLILQLLNKIYNN